MSPLALAIIAALLFVLSLVVLAWRYSAREADSYARRYARTRIRVRHYRAQADRLRSQLTLARVEAALTPDAITTEVLADLDRLPLTYPEDPR